MILTLVALVCAALLVAVAAVSMCEVVLTHLTLARATALADETGTEGSRLVDLVGQRESLLPAALLVRVAGQSTIVAIVAFEVARHDPSGTVWVITAVGLLVALASIEIPAKSLSMARTSAVAVRVAPLIALLGKIPLVGRSGSTLVRLLRRNTNGEAEEEEPTVSEEELLAMAEVAADAEVIETSERALIESIIEFGDTIVREVMVPRPDMVTVNATWAVRDVMEVVIANGYSRIPVVDEGIDDVIGIAYAKDLMRAERDGQGDEPTAQHLRGARFVPEQQRVSMLLPEMQAEQFHMAIVIDEYGGVAGLVTLEDLIEELVGEIVDEFDVEDPMAEPLPGGGFRVNARMPLDEVNDLLMADLPEGDWDTLGGLFFGSLGHVPVQGEYIDIGHHRLTAVRVQGRRIGLVRIDRLDPPEDTAADVTTDAADRESVDR